VYKYKSIEDVSIGDLVECVEFQVVKYSVCVSNAWVPYSIKRFQAALFLVHLVELII